MSFFFRFVLCACLCRLFLRLCLVADLLVLLVLCVVHTHACEFVLDRHDRVAQEHAALCSTHDGEELLRRLCAEARTVAAIADRLRDTVGAAVDLCKDGGEQRRAGRAELARLRAVMFLAVDAEGLADVLFFLRDVVFEFGWLALREEA